MLKILLRPLWFSSIMFVRDNGPVGAINGLVISPLFMHRSKEFEESKQFKKVEVQDDRR